MFVNIFVTYSKFIQSCLEDILSVILIFLRAASMAYGNLQARDRIRAAAAILPTATATRNPSCICDLHHSSQQCQILNWVSEAKDGTRILMDSSWVWYHWATTGTPLSVILNLLWVVSWPNDLFCRMFLMQWEIYLFCFFWMKCSVYVSFVYLVWLSLSLLIFCLIFPSIILSGVLKCSSYCGINHFSN